MRLKDFLLLIVICIVWAMNIVVSRWFLGHESFPPLFLAASRFLGVAILLSPFLLKPPENFKQIFIIAMCMGWLHFGAVYLGMAHTEASMTAIIMQLGTPISTIMSVLILGEVIKWRRGLGIVITVIGAAIVAVNPEGAVLGYGVSLLLIGVLVASYAGILMKAMPKMHALKLQAWISGLSFAPLFLGSYLFESGQISVLINLEPLHILGYAFSVILVGVFAHGSFYILITKYDVTLLNPLTLMTPVMAIGMAWIMLGEDLSIRFFIGGAIVLSGACMIAIRPNSPFPVSALTGLLAPDKKNSE